MFLRNHGDKPVEVRLAEPMHDLLGATTSPVDLVALGTYGVAVLRSQNEEEEEEAGMASITLSDVSKSFDGGHAVAEGPTLDVEDGEFMVLVAPSGCGRTTHDPDTGELVVFAVNRHQSAAVQLCADLRAWPQMRLASSSVLADGDVRATNTADQPDRVRPRPADAAEVDGSVLHVALPPVSWTVLVLGPAAAPTTPERTRS